MANNEKKTKKHGEETSKDPKATEGEKKRANNQEIRTTSPVENTQTQEVTVCHPDQKTNAPAQSQNTASVPLSSNPDQWCSCNGGYISSNVLVYFAAVCVGTARKR